MQKKWSKLWNRSTQSRKQRKFRHNAPLHVRHQFMSAPLSSELKKQYATRNVPVRTGDQVQVGAGQFKNKTGKVTKVSLSKMKIFVEGAEVNRSDGTKAQYPIHPSNVVITKLDTTDKRRLEKLEQVKEKHENGKQ